MRFLGRVTQQAGAVVAADGTATAKFRTVPDDTEWQVARAVVACSGAPAFGATVSCVLHVVGVDDDGPGTATQRSGTNSGMFDESDYAADGLQVFGREQLVAVWAGAPPGGDAVCTITVRQYTTLD